MPIKCRWAKVSVIVMGNGHEAAAFLCAPTLVTGGTRALGKVLFLDCQLEWHVPEEGEAMAAHSSTLAWKSQWTVEPGGLQTMGSLRVRHDWVTSLSLFTFMHWRRKWHSSVLAWRIPGTGEPGGLPSMGLHRVGHDWSDLAAEAVPEETPKASVPFLLPSLPLSPGHISVPATPLCGGCFHHRWGDPKEGSWRWEPHHLETWNPGGFSKLFQPRGSTSFGCSRCSFTAGGPAWIWRLWASAEGNRHARSMGKGSLIDISSPPSSVPRQSIQGTQACSGFRDVTAAQVTKAWREESQHSLLVVCILYWYRGDLQCCRVCLFVSGGEQHDSLKHTCVHVLFLVLFLYSLLCSVA